MHSHRTLLYGGNVKFLCYVPNGEMIKSSPVPLFVLTKHLERTLSENLAKPSLINTIGKDM